MDLAQEAHETALQAWKRVKRLEAKVAVLVRHHFDRAITKEEYLKRMEEIDRQATVEAPDPMAFPHEKIAEAEAMRAGLDLRHVSPFPESSKTRLCGDEIRQAHEHQVYANIERIWETLHRYRTELDMLTKSSEGLRERIDFYRQEVRELPDRMKQPAKEEHSQCTLRRFIIRALPAGHVIYEGVRFSDDSCAVSAYPKGWDREETWFRSLSQLESAHGGRDDQRIEWLD